MYWRCLYYGKNTAWRDCGTFNHYYFSKCSKCQTENDLIPEIRESMDIGLVDQSQNKICPECGTEYNENRFPYSCFEGDCSQTNWFCTDCKSLNNHVTSKCVNCGKNSRFA